MLFPELGPEFYEENDKALLSRMATFYRDSLSINQSFWEQADIDVRFEAGDQSLYHDIYGHGSRQNQRQFNFNRIKRVVNMISGWQRKNRNSSLVVPVENGDAETADQFTKILTWINQREGSLESLSESFHSAVITGFSLLQVWIDYRSDPVSGNIRVDKCSYNSFLLDPFFRKKDLSDCNGLWKRSYLTETECVSLLPDHVDKIKSVAQRDLYDGKFSHMIESTGFNMRKLMAYDEYYYRDYRKQKMLIDSQSGLTMEWHGEDKELKEFLHYYPRATVSESEIPTVRLGIVVNGVVMYDGPNPLGIDRYPFVPILGYYNPDLTDYSLRIQGVVRGLRDAQYLYNRRKVIELDTLESQVNSGWKYKVGSLIDPKQVHLTGQGVNIAMKNDSQMSDVEQIIPRQIPPSTIQLSEILGREILEISGVNEELLGSATDDKAGVLSMLRQGAGMTTLMGLFDQLDESQKNLGSIMVSVIQNNFTPGKVKRIIEAEPSREFYDKAFGRYDVAIEEGVNTTTQRQMQFTQLMKLRELGISIPDEVILEAATLQNKKKLIDSITQASQKKQQIEELQMQVQLGKVQAETKLANARTIADGGLGVERFSRVGENEALVIERRAESKKDLAQGLLNITRALKEIESLDLAQLEKLILLSRSVNSELGKEAEQDIPSPNPLSGGVAALSRMSSG